MRAKKVVHPVRGMNGFAVYDERQPLFFRSMLHTQVVASSRWDAPDAPDIILTRFVAPHDCLFSPPFLQAKADANFGSANGGKDACYGQHNNNNDAGDTNYISPTPVADGFQQAVNVIRSRGGRR